MPLEGGHQIHSRHFSGMSYCNFPTLFHIQTHFFRLGTPNPFCRRFEFALQKGLKKSDTFISTSDTFFWESITKLASPPGALLAGLTQWRQGSDGKQPIAYRVSWTRPIDHASCAEENDSRLPRPTCNLFLFSELERLCRRWGLRFATWTRVAPKSQCDSQKCVRYRSHDFHKQSRTTVKSIK